MEGVSPDLIVEYILNDDLKQEKKLQTVWELKRLTLEEQTKVEKLYEESRKQKPKGAVEVDDDLRLKAHMQMFKLGIRRLRNWRFSESDPNLRAKGWIDIDCHTDFWMLKKVMEELPSDYQVELIGEIDQIGKLKADSKKKGRASDLVADVEVRSSGESNGGVHVPDVQPTKGGRKNPVGKTG